MPAVSQCLNCRIVIMLMHFPAGGTFLKCEEDEIIRANWSGKTSSSISNWFFYDRSYNPDYVCAVEAMNAEGKVGCEYTFHIPYIQSNDFGSVRLVILGTYPSSMLSNGNAYSVVSQIKAEIYNHSFCELGCSTLLPIDCIA